LGDSKLVVRDEDSVSDIVHHRASEDLPYFRLREWVQFEFLSSECMTRAFDFISTSFESLTFGIWSSLRDRLTLTVTSSTSQTDRFYSVVIDSKIISTIPSDFWVFERNQLRLLHRGSRDGFEASAFHDH
jgi:hypothetical protein